MLQLVSGITLILVSGAAFFAWIENRPTQPQYVTGSRDSNRLSKIFSD
ncbi:MAG: hypothetical protein KME38_04250 [Spirirestis rafaelensis WJT71-NPBG6]|nr:hypothetical protein [Spirirestis rafaelensis WJT71-NPBG6]